MESKERVVFSQEWNWHDPLGSGKYIIGEDQFFTMDGSFGRIQNNRLLKERITDASGAVEVAMQVTCGRVYHIVLYDSKDRLAVDLRIDRDGKMAFHDGKDYVDSGARLTFQSGEGEREWVDNSIGPTWFQSNRPPDAWRSTLHSYEFGGFDFQEGSFSFKLDGKRFRAPLAKEASDISKLELQTETVEPGTAIWLDHYKQTKGGEQIDYEDFPYFWNDWAVREFYPEARWFDSRLSLKAHKWLEVCTRYGDIVCRLPAPVLKGSMEFTVMTTDVRQEVAFAIWEQGQRRGEEAGGMWLMIYNGLWSTAEKHRHSWEDIVAAVESRLIVPGGHYYYESFDPPIKAENGKFYKVKIEWDNSNGTWRLWIDGELRKNKGESYNRPLAPLKKGVDTLRLHPGAHVYPHGGIYSYSYWGTFTVKSNRG